MTTADQLKHDSALLQWHPMAHPRAVKAQRPDIIARGEGCWMWDVDGRPVEEQPGPPPPRGARAIVEQLDELPFFNTVRGTTRPRPSSPCPR